MFDHSNSIGISNHRWLFYITDPYVNRGFIKMYEQLTKQIKYIQNKELKLKNGISEVHYEGLWKKTFGTAIIKGGGIGGINPAHREGKRDYYC